MNTRLILDFLTFNIFEGLKTETDMCNIRNFKIKKTSIIY